MKKSVLAMAVLSTLSFGALADVTVYGVVDGGFNYSHVKTDGQKADNNFEMKSGQQSGSRFGIEGSEALSENVTAGFILEGGFNMDDGELGQNGRVFGREANLFVITPAGEFSMGRVGGVGGGNGSYGLLGQLSPFGTSWGDFSANVSNYLISAGRMDNTFTYRTPEMAGWQLTAQYSLKAASVKDDLAFTNGQEGTEDANRYMAVGLSYMDGPLTLVAVVDSMDYSNLYDFGRDNSVVATVGGSYDFGCFKPYLGVQYFDKAVRGLMSGSTNGFERESALVPMDGWAWTAGADMPAFGGTAKVGMGYVKAKQTEQRDNEFDRIGASLGYEYNLSKHTNLYAATSYMKTSYEFGDKVDQKAVEVLTGLRHTF